MKNIFIGQEDKAFIMNSLNELESELNKEMVLFADTQYPSLFLWIQFQKYSMKIIYEYTKKPDFDKLEKIFTLTELYDFNIDAVEEKQKSLEKINKYIKSVKDNLR